MSIVLSKLSRIICFVFAGLVPVIPAVAQEQEVLPPLNIVWLSVEDMSPWLACYGDDTVDTPNIDRLAREGVRYENAYASSPVCAPARSSLITGMYATRIGTMHMRNGNPSRAAMERDPQAYADIPGYEGMPPAFVRCFPEHLRVAGYYCTNNSKKDYQFKEPVTVWDESSRQAHWRNRAEGQPFFAVFNCGLTHESRAFPKANRQPEVVSPAEVPLPPFYPDTPEVRDAVARTYNNIAAMDLWLGEKMEELEDAGLLENTVVIFFSDHGVGLPRGKRSVYDTGTRVPLIVRYPDGRGAGTTDDRVVSFIDFGPSVLSLAGIESDERLDGVPFVGEHAREGIGLSFTHADRFDAEREQTRSVTDGRYRYVRNYITQVPHLIDNAYRENLLMTAQLYALRQTGPPRPEQWQMASTVRPAEEFYDTQSDPWEVQNLIDDPQHAERISQMRAAVEAWIEDTGDLGFVLPETVLVRDHIWAPDGVQPTTAEPVVNCDIAQREGRMYYDVTITCETPGASIGYRLSDHAQHDGPWTVYTPGEVLFTTGDVRFLEVAAHRIGHKPVTTQILLGGE